MMKKRDPQLERNLDKILSIIYSCDSAEQLANTARWLRNLKITGNFEKDQQLKEIYFLKIGILGEYLQTQETPPPLFI